MCSPDVTTVKLQRSSALPGDINLDERGKEDEDPAKNGLKLAMVLTLFQSGPTPAICFTLDHIKFYISSTHESWMAVVC